MLRADSLSLMTPDPAAPPSAEILAKLTQVEQNAWMLFSELPPCGAKTRALHVYLDAKAIKSKLETVPA
jgi:hypothetical protein